MLRVLFIVIKLYIHFPTEENKLPAETKGDQQDILAVYHLHGQTGRFTVRANGKQNSRLVNFFPE